MKTKRIVSIAFCTLILVTMLVFAVSAIRTYRIETADPAVDILEDMGAAMVAIIGGAVVFFECDLFYTVRYLLFGQKRRAKTALVVVANVTLLLILLYAHLSDKYMGLRQFEVTPFVLFAVYLVIRVAALLFRPANPDKAPKGGDASPS